FARYFAHSRNSVSNRHTSARSLGGARDGVDPRHRISLPKPPHDQGHGDPQEDQQQSPTAGGPASSRRAVAAARWLLGLPNALLWGVMATLVNFVPLLGALCGVAVIFLVSLLTFDSIAFALLPPFVFWIITTTEGNFITPMVLGKSMSLNPFVVFLFLTVWAWMWGIGGAFLAVPILAVLKVGFDQFERTRPLGTLLGGVPPT
ncbi:MAG: AI-2E family transporter, partial [Maioricimonas sp. JB049]